MALKFLPFGFEYKIERFLIHDADHIVLVHAKLYFYIGLPRRKSDIFIFNSDNMGPAICSFESFTYTSY